jgi:hypothetical protein
MRQSPNDLHCDGRGSRHDHQVFEKGHASLSLHRCTDHGEAERLRHGIAEVVERQQRR